MNLNKSVGIMLRKIISLLKENSFSRLKGKDRDFQNKRLGIYSSFEDEENNHIEIYKEHSYYSVYLYGKKFMSSYHPKVICVVDNAEFNKLTNSLK